MFTHTNVPSNGILCKANLYSDFTVTTDWHRAVEDVESPSRSVRLFCEVSSLEEM